MKIKFYIGEREYSNGEFKTNVIRECASYFDAAKVCDEIAAQWAAEGLAAKVMTDEYESTIGVCAYDPQTYDRVHDYMVCREYQPEAGAIDPAIGGYEHVKDVVYAIGSERTGYDMLFAVRRDCGGDYLRGLCEVRENTSENRDELEAKYPFDTHIVWSGCVRSLPKGCAVMPCGGDIIDFYWS